MIKEKGKGKEGKGKKEKGKGKEEKVRKNEPCELYVLENV